MGQIRFDWFNETIIRRAESFLLTRKRILKNHASNDKGEKDDPNRDQAEIKSGDSFCTKDPHANQKKLKLDTCLADQYKLITKFNLNLIFYA